jgi:S-sulfosulfanyl-L-cysteine sulfohydrolase
VIDPNAATGRRITRMELDGKPIKASGQYTVAGWAPVSEDAMATGGEPVWEVAARYLRAQKTITPRKLDVPKLEGIGADPGLAPT